MKKRLTMFVIAALCLSFPFAYAYAGGLAPQEFQTRYEALEELFRKEVTYVTVNFHEQRDSYEDYSYHYYFFKAEVEPGGEVAMEFSNIAAAEYNVYVAVYNKRDELLFSGSAKIEVGGGMLTQAEVVLEIAPNIKVFSRLSVDLGEQDIESVEVRYLFFDQNGAQIDFSWQEAPYIALEKRLAIWPIYTPPAASRIEVYLPRYDVRGTWDVNWEKRTDVNISLSDPPPYAVALQARFLTEREEGRVWVVPVDFGTIQEAIDASSSGDLIRVWPGTYYGPLTLKPGIEIEGSAAGISPDWRQEGRATLPLIYGKGDGQSSASAKVRGLNIRQYFSDSSAPVILLEGFDLVLEKCLVVGQESQPLIRAMYSAVQIKNCTFSGGSSGLEVAYSYVGGVAKSVFLGMKYPILLMAASVNLDQTSIFWNCQSYPEGARVEDPMLQDYYFWPLSGSPCTREEIGVYY